MGFDEIYCLRPSGFLYCITSIPMVLSAKDPEIPPRVEIPQCRSVSILKFTSDRPTLLVSGFNSGNVKIVFCNFRSVLINVVTVCCWDPTAGAGNVLSWSNLPVGMSCVRQQRTRSALQFALGVLVDGVDSCPPPPPPEVRRKVWRWTPRR